MFKIFAGLTLSKRCSASYKISVSFSVNASSFKALGGGVGVGGGGGGVQEFDDCMNDAHLAGVFMMACLHHCNCVQ